MSDDKKIKGWDGSGAHTGNTLSDIIPPRDPNAPVPPYKTRRPKRRRKGQLNDGEWAPGYGPKKRGEPD